MQPAPAGFVRLNRAGLDRELSRRGLTGTELARLAGITPETFSRIRCGAATRAETFKAIAAALSSIPIIEGADLLLGPTAGEE
jgi:transcriptional regulator with XRE-family HTH domain